MHPVVMPGDDIVSEIAGAADSAPVSKIAPALPSAGQAAARLSRQSAKS